MKIRERLTLTLSLTTALTIVSLGVFVYFTTKDFHQQEFFKRLNERVQITELIFLEKNEAVTEAIRNRFLQRLDLEQEYAITLSQGGLDSLDRLFYKGLSQDLISEGYAEFWQGNRQGVARRYDIPSGNYAVVVTALDVFGQTKLAYLKRTLIIGGAIFVFLMVVVSWLSIRRALMPLVRKIEKAKRISATQLGLRLNVFNPKDELGQLAITFNNMLDRLQAAFESQKQFVSNASHEIRNPLTAIIGEAELLLSKDRSPEQYKEALEVILDESRRLNTLTQQLLELAKTESLATLPDPEEICLDICLLELIEKFPPQRLQLKLEPNLAGCTVRGNQYLLHTALSNLLENALKYSQDKIVRIELFVKQEHFQIKIEDQGIGIPPEEMEKIFQPLYRARNARSLKGHGIGLTLAKKIIELHNGTLHFESVYGQGTTAVARLPRF